MRRRKSQRTAEDAAQQESAPGAASDEDADLCTPPPRSTQPIRRAGFLSKKGGGTRRRNWKKRWFVLDGAQLVYYAPDDRKVSLRARGNDDFDQTLLSYGFGARGSNDAGNELFGKGEPKGVIPLVGATVKVLPQDAHRTREWCFVLSSGGMSYDGDRDDEDDDGGDGDGDGDGEANGDGDNQATKDKLACGRLNGSKQAATTPSLGKRGLNHNTVEGDGKPNQEKAATEKDNNDDQSDQGKEGDGEADGIASDAKEKEGKARAKAKAKAKAKRARRRSSIKPDRVFMIEAPTELLRKAWMDSINSALLLLQPRPNPLQQLACKLGFPHNEPYDQIDPKRLRRAYHQLALRHHPDRQGRRRNSESSAGNGVGAGAGGFDTKNSNDDASSKDAFFQQALGAYETLCAAREMAVNDRRVYEKISVTVPFQQGRGLGIRVINHGKAPLNRASIKAVVDGGCAARSGLLRVGDVLVSVCGAPLVGMQFDEIMAQLRGVQPPSMELIILRSIPEEKRKKSSAAETLDAMPAPAPPMAQPPSTKPPPATPTTTNATANGTDRPLPPSSPPPPPPAPPAPPFVSDAGSSMEPSLTAADAANCTLTQSRRKRGSSEVLRKAKIDKAGAQAQTGTQGAATDSGYANEGRGDGCWDDDDLTANQTGSDDELNDEEEDADDVLGASRTGAASLALSNFLSHMPSRLGCEGGDDDAQRELAEQLNALRTEFGGLHEKAIQEIRLDAEARLARVLGLARSRSRAAQERIVAQARVREQAARDDLAAEKLHSTTLLQQLEEARTAAAAAQPTVSQAASVAAAAVDAASAAADLQAELQAARKAAGVAEDEAARLRADLEAAQAETLAASPNLEEEVARWRTEAATSEARALKVEAEAEGLVAQAVATARANAEAETDALRARITELNERAASAEVAAARAASLTEAVKAAHITDKTEVVNARDNAVEQIADAKADAVRMANMLKASEEKAAHLEAQVKSYDQERRTAEARADEAERRCSRAQVQLEEVRSAQAEAQDAMNAKSSLAKATDAAAATATAAAAEAHFAARAELEEQHAREMRDAVAAARAAAEAQSEQIRAEYEARLAKGFEKAVVEGCMLATPPGASGSSGQASPSLSTPTSSPREGGYVRVQQALLETRLKSALQREQGLQKLVRKLQTALLSSKEEAMKARMTVIAGSPTKSSDILYPDLEAVTPSADTVPAFDSDGFS